MSRIPEKRTPNSGPGSVPAYQQTQQNTVTRCTLAVEHQDAAFQLATAAPANVQRETCKALLPPTGSLELTGGNVIWEEDHCLAIAPLSENAYQVAFTLFGLMFLVEDVLAGYTFELDLL